VERAGQRAPLDRRLSRTPSFGGGAVVMMATEVVSLCLHITGPLRYAIRLPAADDGSSSRSSPKCENRRYRTESIFCPVSDQARMRACRACR
jgi:hypothetical protein